MVSFLVAVAGFSSPLFLNREAFRGRELFIHFLKNVNCIMNYFLLKSGIYKKLINKGLLFWLILAKDDTDYGMFKCLFRIPQLGLEGNV